MHSHLLGGVNLLAIVNNAAMNLGNLFPFSIFFCFLFRSGITGSRDNAVFNSLSCHTVFPTGCSILPSHQLYTGVPTFLHAHQHVLRFFLVVATLTGVWLYLFVVLLCISLMVADLEHVFMCILVICRSSFEKCLFPLSNQDVCFVEVEYYCNST